MIPRVRKWIKRATIAVFLIGLVLALALFFFPQPFLTVDSGPATGEVIVVLGGGSHERPDQAAELFRQHAAPRIIVSGYGDGEINRRLLVAAGVPAGSIALENRSRTTRENAEFTIRLLREQKVKRVIIVTSWYHSRRALACFQHYAPEIRFYSRPSYVAYARADWSQHRVRTRIRLEYLKLAGYWVRYGVGPF